MAMRVAIMLVTLAIAVSWCYPARGMDSDPREYVCDPGSHDPKSDAGKVFDSILDYIHNHAADQGYNVQKQETIGDDTYYGQAACDGNISQGECSDCIDVIYNAAITLCGFSNGALVKSASCRIRVANHPFDPNY